MWTWDQSAGKLSHDEKLVSKGYAGAGRGLNNPAMQAATGIGPIPAGMWTMTSIGKSANTGPNTIVLEPDPGTNTFGRSAFRIHGDNSSGLRNASHGCIILPLAVRLQIWRSGDRKLQVVT